MGINSDGYLKKIATRANKRINYTKVVELERMTFWLVFCRRVKNNVDGF